MVSEHLELFLSLNRKNLLAQICGSITAHARCINAIDCNREGLVVSVSDDCFIRLWKLSDDEDNLEVDEICFEYDKSFSTKI